MTPPRHYNPEPKFGLLPPRLCRVIEAANVLAERADEIRGYALAQANAASHLDVTVDPCCPPGWVVAFSNNGSFSAMCGNRSMVGKARNLLEVYDLLRSPAPPETPDR